MHTHARTPIMYFCCTIRTYSTIRHYERVHFVLLHCTSYLLCYLLPENLLRRLRKFFCIEYEYTVPRTSYLVQCTLLLLCLLCAPPRPPRRIRTRAHIAQFHCVVSIIVFCINQCGLPPLLFCHSRSYEQSTARARTLSYLVLSTQKRSLHYHTRFHAYILCTSYL